MQESRTRSLSGIYRLSTLPLPFGKMASVSRKIVAGEYAPAQYLW
ncbi:MAG: hypothetical protein Q8Q54_15260 [Methylococcales bacterium]|nr:hypothetical protein [Methylococcales bacterium]MDP3840274.1 hypothetical protein [Methylococcales bacterium]